MYSYTPGPWKKFASEFNQCIANAKTGEIVCDIPRINYRDDRLVIRWEHNVPLIAAAPDLLEIMKIVYAYVSPALQPNIYKMMQEVIAKAEGKEFQS